MRKSPFCSARFSRLPDNQPPMKQKKQANTTKMNTHKTINQSMT
jgi:hypothetical protein